MKYDKQDRMLQVLKIERDEMSLDQTKLREWTREIERRGGKVDPSIRWSDLSPEAARGLLGYSTRGRASNPTFDYSTRGMASC